MLAHDAFLNVTLRKGKKETGSIVTPEIQS